MACQEGHAAIVELLLAHKADANHGMTHDNSNALIMAAEEGFLPLVKLLLAGG